MSDTDARISALEPPRQVLLQAPAGSGKTTVLAQRFLRLLATVDEPEQVLAITFTRKAAAEMRERVLQALEDGLPSTQADREQWRELRTSVLSHARERRWDAEELPTRLRIQTIDSLNHELARAMPLLGRMQPSLEVVDDAKPLYLQAARLALLCADEPTLQADVDALLLRLDNDWDRAENLLAGMLASRGRWLPVLLDTNPDHLADRIMASLTRIVDETLRGAIATLPTDLQHEAALLARSSAANRQDAADAGEGNWRIWLNESTRLDADCRSLSAWRAIAELALTGAGEWRKPRGINKRQGFPTTDKPLKARWQRWAEGLQTRAAHAPLLRTLLSLPDPVVDVTERQALAGLARVLLQSAAQLQLVFRDSGQVDHNEVAAVARLALCDMGEPTDLSLRQTLRVHHLLVDEFQDISPEQRDLIEALMVGWEAEDGRSIFLVGDPMQSIYLFRDSEVGLFLEARTGGIGGRELCSLQLRRNFRSVTPLVEWVNNAFRDIFPATEDVRTSAVPYLSAEAVRAGASNAPVTVWPQPTSDPWPEARQIAAECSRLRAGNPQLRCAILLQARTAAPPILRALREAGVQALGVDLAPLSELPVVRDVLSIARALLHAGDRTAWLSVLRAPFCGLTLGDLYQLCGHDPEALLTECLADSSRIAQLSLDGQRRLARCAPLLLKSFEGRRRDHLANCVESLWIQLGGPAACQDEADLSAARQFLLALREQEQTDPALDGDRLDALAQRLRAGSDGTDSNSVEVLTIHHAKGLEWDVVFVPGLGRRVRSDQPPLLRWLQLPAHGGAQDLLMAVHSMGERVTSDPLSGYIRRLQKERQDNERRRLAYVAATRARERLYLSGHAPWNEELQMPQPDARSQLAILWPAVRDNFLAALSSGGAAATASTAASAPWYRLDASFTHEPRRRMPGVGSLAAGLLATNTQPEFEWAGPLARAAGTLVHREFELLTLATEPEAIDFLARTSLYVTQLCELGVDYLSAQATAKQVAGRMTEVVRDANARWLLSPAHRSAVSELRLTGVVGGRLRNIVIDRSFVDEKGVRWVIDYKTSSHAGGGLAEFLASEQERYRPQLELYVELARRLGPEPVRAALYFPWLGELLEVA